MASELFEDGLLRSNLRKQAKAESEQPGPAPDAAEDPGADAMARQKQELTNQAAGTVKEIESLRQRQRDLEREKETIEKAARRQESYEDGKREMISRLSHALVAIRKEQEEVSRTAELLEATKIRFENSLEELRQINEEQWPESEFAVKVEEAMAVVEAARSTYDRSQARLDAVSWLRQSEKLAAGESPVERLAGRMQNRPGFGYWLIVGIAVMLPLAVTAVALYVVNLFVAP